MTDYAVIRDPARREHFVYRAYDKADRLLYVGCTMRPRQRWADHSRYSPWAREAVRFRVVGPFNYDTARELERQALRNENPLHGFTPARRSAHVRHWRRTDQHMALLMADGSPWTDVIDEALRRADRDVPEWRSA